MQPIKIFVGHRSYNTLKHFNSNLYSSSNKQNDFWQNYWKEYMENQHIYYLYIYNQDSKPGITCMVKIWNLSRD